MEKDPVKKLLSTLSAYPEGYWIHSKKPFKDDPPPYFHNVIEFLSLRKRIAFKQGDYEEAGRLQKEINDVKEAASREKSMA